MILAGALGIGAGHGLLLRRLVARLGRGAGGATGVVMGALLLRLLPAAALLTATWWGAAETALVALAGPWLGRTAVLTAVARRV